MRRRAFIAFSLVTAALPAAYMCWQSSLLELQCWAVGAKTHSLVSVK